MRLHENMDLRKMIADIFIKGSGIEIGALQNPLPVNNDVSVTYVDKYSIEHSRELYPELDSFILKDVDIFDDGETLELIPDDSQDFIIANHFIEHCKDFISTIKTHLKKLKTGGVLYYAVPDKRYTFDKDRNLTTWLHISDDYKNIIAERQIIHIKEWIEIVEHITDKDLFLQRADEIIDTNYSIHYHVWTMHSFLNHLIKLDEYSGPEFEIELAVNNTHEFIIILRKL